MITTRSTGMCAAFIAFGVSLTLGQSNDACPTPTVLVGAGPFAFDNTAATTGSQSQDELLCNFFGTSAIDLDLWFRWTAPASSAYTLTLCGQSSIDSKVAIYNGTGCPSGSAIACNDDACGLQSQVSFATTTGNSYTIQLGSYPSSPGGAGTFAIVNCPDADGDGIPDCIDGCPLDPLQTAPGVCGCGSSAGTQMASLYEPGPLEIPPASTSGGGSACAKTPDRTPVNSVYLFSGEFHQSIVDLKIKGRGFDFICARKYRSRAGSNTLVGNNWDMSYNIRVEANGANRIIHDGNSRSDTYTLQPNGRWSRREFFRELAQNGDGSYSLTLPDNGKWNFLPLNASPSRGKISSIVDRNGNAMTFNYDGLGRLVTIHDTLDTLAHGRDITIAYNPDGFVSSVTDWTGRQVIYSYYSNADAGGSFGDLKSVRSPIVAGTPNGNDYPAGKTTVYTYSKNFTDARLNGNLLTITDAKGQTNLTNVYSATQSDTDPAFDHVVRQIWGDPGDNVDLAYVPLAATDTNNYSIVKAIVNDRVGNVSERCYDALNRLTILREYTGRADPDQPTTETANRPTNQLRPGDPAFFETLYCYNADSLVKRVFHPNGNISDKLYEADLNPNAPVRSRGNLREVNQLPGPLGGNQAVLTERFEYQSGFGGCCDSNFVTAHTDARGNITGRVYDANGNRLHTQERINTVIEDWEYNSAGQMTAHILPDNGSGHRQRNEYHYYAAGPGFGYLSDEIVDGTGYAMTTVYQYDAVGNVTRSIDPEGNDELSTYNQLDQQVQFLSRVAHNTRVETLTWYDGNNNIVRTDIQNRDEAGNLDGVNASFTIIYEYDATNHRTRMVEERGAANILHSVLAYSGIPAGDRPQFIVTENQYDANRNVSTVRYGEAVSGRQPSNSVRTDYDERDLIFRQSRAPGTAAQSTNQRDYDGNQNRVALREGLENSPEVTLFTYDGFGREVSVQDPMGNVSTSHYDPNGNRLAERVYGELVDVVGSTGNVRLSEILHQYDSMDRLIRSDTKHFVTTSQTPIGSGQSTQEMAYTDSSRLRGAVDDSGHQTTCTYDSANRLSAVRDHQNNTVLRTYDSNSNVIAITELEQSRGGTSSHMPGRGGRKILTKQVYDPRDLPIGSADNVGNKEQFRYDSRGNRTLAVDARGNHVRYTYDGVNRLMSTSRDMNGNGVCTDPGDIVTSQSWDDSNRMRVQMDENGNATESVYDGLNRLTSIEYADGTVEKYSLDAHGNRIGSLDANGTVQSCTYDLLHRITQRDITPGPLVSGDTTTEVYRYDGMSRVVEAADNDSIVQRSYSSLALCLTESLNGRVTSCVYNGLGLRTQLIYPGGRIISTTFDGLDRRHVITEGGALIANYDYIGSEARVSGRRFGNGTRTDYEYDGVLPNPPNDFGVNQIVRTKHWRSSDGMIIDVRRYSWDRAANKTSRTDERIGGARLAHSYGYDSAQRLVNTTVLNANNQVVRNTRYELDGDNNRSKVEGSAGAGLYTCSGLSPEPADCQVNQYTKTPFDGRTYDRKGNLTRYGAVPGGQRYLLSYDYRNQMVEHSDLATGASETYSYDALGRRIGRVVDAFGVPIRTQFYFEGHQEIEEQDSAGNTTATYVYGNYIDEVVMMRRGGADYYYHTDDLYNVMAITNATGAVVERYEYQDYGDPQFLDSVGNPILGTAIGNPILFSGRRYDAGSGLYYFRTRYLEPKVGSFTTRDTIGIWGDSDGLGNGYTYAGNNPWSGMDPGGTKKGWFKKAVNAVANVVATVVRVALAIPTKLPSLLVRCTLIGLNHLLSWEKFEVFKDRPFYGNWCGRGNTKGPNGANLPAIDKLDSCCEDHDQCAKSRSVVITFSKAERECNRALCECAFGIDCDYVSLSSSVPTAADKAKSCRVAKRDMLFTFCLRLL